MTISENITFQSCGETLVGTIDWNAQKTKPSVLFLSGSLPGDRSYASYLTTALAEKGLSCFRFDYAGHGESSGTLEKATINHLVQQAVDALPFMDKDKPLVFIGASLGGGPALELLSHVNVDTMILLAPGAWTEEGYAAPYENRYDYHVNNEDDAKRCPAFAKLKQYTGKFMHVIGGLDDVIKPEVTKQMKLNSMNATCHFHVIEGAGHRLRLWLLENPEEKDRFVEMIIAFIKQNNS